MRKSLAIAAILILTGCAVASIKITSPNGHVKEASTVSFFKDIAGGQVNLADETFNVNGSKVDIEVLLKILQSAR